MLKHANATTFFYTFYLWKEKTIFIEKQYITNRICSIFEVPEPGKYTFNDWKFMTDEVWIVWYVMSISINIIKKL